MRLYTYVIRNDDGSAPNYDTPHTTLAICKPDIRRCARKGDVVLAFTGKELSREPHAVCWAGVIKRKMPFANYWNHPWYQAKKPGRSARPDNIYEPVHSELRQVPNRTHDAGNIDTDLRGKFVLVMHPIWHFGNTGPALPESMGFRMIGLRRKHRVHELTPLKWRKLKKWLDSHPQSRITKASRVCSRFRAPARVCVRTGVC